MAQNVKRGRGSNQYADKLEAAPAEERRLPRKRRWGMSKSGKMMATPGKPFQCPSCGELHPTGHMCSTCNPEVVTSLRCAGCGQAMMPSGATLCDDCEELALVTAGEAQWAPMAATPSLSPTAPTGRPVPSMPPAGPPAGVAPYRPPQGPTGPYAGPPPGRPDIPSPNGSLPPRRLPQRRPPSV